MKMPDQNTLHWGPINLPLSEATGHFLAIGARGSGKTVIMRRFLQSVVPTIVPDSDTRLLTFDIKQDMLPLLAGMRARVPVRTTSPFDARGVAWDLSRDVREPQVATEIAFTLFPELQESQPFFTDAARHLLWGVLIRFLLGGAEWNLGDVLRAMRKPRQLRSVLKGAEHTRDLVDQYLRDPRLAANISSTIATKLLPFEPIAAAWDSATEKVSLEEWATSSQILILGNSETSRTAIQAINRCMFKRAMDICLHQSESFSRRTFVLADELVEAGRLPGFVSALKRGRSKGLAVCAGFQSVAGLRDPKLYGPYFSAELLGLFANRFIGRLECPETAEFVSKLFGDQEIENVSTSRTSSNQGGSFTESRQQVIRRAVLPGELMALPTCSRENGLQAFYLVRSVGAFPGELAGDVLFDRELCPPDPNTPELIARPVQCQFLAPWTGEQKRRLLGTLPNREAARPRRRKDRELDEDLEPLA